MVKNTLLYIVLFFSLPLSGINPVVNDTIRIREVVIRTRKADAPAAGYKKTSIDTTILSLNRSKNLSELLFENTGIYIKSYGIGGTATPSFRGTGASHTIIDWNGININSPMPGQSDLSLIPAGLIDEIQIYHGSASMQLNTGGIGGAINLETKPVWKKETIATINSGFGSLGRYTGLINVKTGNYNFQTVTKAFFQKAENNFRYLNDKISFEPIWQSRTNSQVQQKGFVQEVYLHKGTNTASARMWYETSDRNLPSSILTLQSNSNEKQFDESFRAMMNFDMVVPEGNFSLTAAWLMSRLNYSNQLVNIDSRNLSESLVIKASYDGRIGDYSKLKVVLDQQSDLIKSNNYDHNATRSTTTLTVSVNRKKDFAGTFFLLREIIIKNRAQIPDFSAGVQIGLLNGKEYFIGANISKNSKIPAMNDLYWNPGGNSRLKNEHSLSAEISYSMKERIADMIEIKYDLSAYHNIITDMILWHPGEFSYWSADNLKTVKATGLESALSAGYSSENFHSRLRLSYSFTKSVGGRSEISGDASVGRQLIYIPENQANCSLVLGYKKLYSNWTTCFVGKRYTTSDNSEYLTGYVVNNFTAGMKIPIKKSSADISFCIDNVFNAEYQSIAYFPLPGRTYNIKISIQFVKKR
jgi:vitamin B12 transporter